MPHADFNSEFTPELYPPFPEGLNCLQLPTISLKKLLEGDEAEQTRVFDSCCASGFFLLYLNDSEQGRTIARSADAFAALGEKFFHLPTEEKVKYSVSKTDGTIFGYKAANVTQKDKDSVSRDSAEVFSVSKDDAFADDDKMGRDVPQIFVEEKAMLREYATTCHAVGSMIFEAIAGKLGISKEDVQKRHSISEPSGDYIRVARGPPRKSTEAAEIQIPSHTDFGTVTLLKNWLGGLQVWSNSARKAGVNEPEDAGEWLWARPQKDCLFINMGDAALKFTNGIFASGRHRVLPAPGDQGKFTRISVVYQLRPIDTCKMAALKGEGVPPAEASEEDDMGAKEWTHRQYHSLAVKGRNM